MHLVVIATNFRDKDELLLLIYLWISQFDLMAYFIISKMAEDRNSILWRILQQSENSIHWRNWTCQKRAQDRKNSIHLPRPVLFCFPISIIYLYSKHTSLSEIQTFLKYGKFNFNLPFYLFCQERKMNRMLCLLLLYASLVCLIYF